jgi:hypothetical protein
MIHDWAAAGLLRPSVVKGIVGTAEQSLISRKLGSLSPADLQQVDRCLWSLPPGGRRAIFRLTTPLSASINSPQALLTYQG